MIKKINNLVIRIFLIPFYWIFVGLTKVFSFFFNSNMKSPDSFWLNSEVSKIKEDLRSPY